MYEGIDDYVEKLNRLLNEDEFGRAMLEIEMKRNYPKFIKDLTLLQVTAGKPSAGEPLTRIRPPA